MEFLADLGNCLQLCFGVEGAPFRGVGDVDRTGIDHVLYVFVRQQGGGQGPQLPRVQLAQTLRQRQDLGAQRLRRTGFVHMDVAGLGGNDALPGLQDGGQHHGVGLGPAAQKKDFGIGTGASSSNFLPGVF